MMFVQEAGWIHGKSRLEYSPVIPFALAESLLDSGVQTCMEVLCVTKYTVFG